MCNKQWNWSNNEESLKKKSPGPDWFSAEFYLTFKEEWILTLLNLFHEIEKKGILPISFYEVGITLTVKQRKRELQANFFNEFTFKNAYKH
jgi:hypothetical protein